MVSTIFQFCWSLPLPRTLLRRVAQWIFFHVLRELGKFFNPVVENFDASVQEKVLVQLRCAPRNGQNCPKINFRSDVWKLQFYIEISFSEQKNTFRIVTRQIQVHSEEKKIHGFIDRFPPYRQSHNFFSSEWT